MKPNILTAVCILAFAAACCHGQHDFEGELNWYLKNNISRFSKNLLPRIRQDKVVYITMDTMLSQIVSVDTAKQIIIISAFMQATWEEERLVWDPTKFGGVKSINWDASAIWFPVIMIYNGIGDSQFLSPQFPVYLISKTDIHTEVTANWRREFEFSCHFDMSRFPNDRHTCELEFFFSDQGHDNKMVIPVANTQYALNITALYRESIEWMLINASSYAQLRPYRLLHGYTYEKLLPTFVIKLVIKRVSKYYLINVITPVLLLTLLQVLMYFVPLESGEKLGFGITIMLSYTVFLLLLDGILPKSQSTPAIASFITAAMILSTVSLLLTSLIMRFHFAPEGTRMPDCMRAVFVGFLGRLFCVTGSSATQITHRPNDAPKSECSERKFDECSPVVRSDWVVAAHGVERLMVVLGVGATAAIIGVFVVQPIVEN